MAENFDHPGPDPDQPHPEGDFPTDFFDDVTEPSPVTAAPAPSPAPSPAPAPPRPVPIATAPASYSPPPAEERRGVPVFPVVLGVLMVAALGAAWFMNRQKDEPAPAPSSTPTAAAPAPTPEATATKEAPTTKEATETKPAAPAPVADDGEVKGLKSQVETLASEVKALQGKVDGLSKPAPAPDLKPVHTKLEELERSVASVAPLPEKVGKVDERIGALDETLKSVKGEIEALKAEVKKASEAAASAATKPAAADEPAGANALTQGAELFKAGKYKEANDAFKALAAGSPKDARVYYWAALANGSATSDWRGETERLVNKGVELEKAGTPKAAEIDAALADIPATLKPWLDAYRKRAR